MTNTLRSARLRAAVLGTLIALTGTLALGPAAAASATLGSVPSEVAAYVADGSMVARLNAVYGPNGAGKGIDFDATTKAGPISRVYEWTAERRTDATTDHPIQLTNNWVVPITINGRDVGLATIWINPQSVVAELASFDGTAALATAMSKIPATSALVRDTDTHAWFALDSGTLTPLISGTSGLVTPAPVASLKLSSDAPPAAPAGDPNTGLALAIAALALVIVVILVALLLPRGRSRRRTQPPAAAAPSAAAVALVEPEPPIVEPESSLVEPVETRPPAAPPTLSTPITKRPASKPGGRSTGTSAASTKPRTQKPPVQKPPVQKPVQKPAASAPPAVRPPIPRADPTSQPSPKPAAKPTPKPTPQSTPKPAPKRPVDPDVPPAS